MPTITQAAPTERERLQSEVRRSLDQLQMVGRTINQELLNESVMALTVEMERVIANTSEYLRDILQRGRERARFERQFQRAWPGTEEWPGSEDAQRRYKKMMQNLCSEIMLPGKEKKQKMEVEFNFT